MPDKPTTSKGQLLFRIALVAMVLFAIGAGIGLARRSPPPPVEDSSISSET